MLDFINGVIGDLDDIRTTIEEKGYSVGDGIELEPLDLARLFHNIGKAEAALFLMCLMLRGEK